MPTWQVVQSRRSDHFGLESSRNPRVVSCRVSAPMEKLQERAPGDPVELDWTERQLQQTLHHYSNGRIHGCSTSVPLPRSWCTSTPFSSRGDIAARVRKSLAQSVDSADDVGNLGVHSERDEGQGSIDLNALVILVIAFAILFENAVCHGFSMEVTPSGFLPVILHSKPRLSCIRFSLRAHVTKHQAQIRRSLV